MDKLTLQDLTNALEDKRHNGWGFAQVEVLPVKTAAKLARLVITTANAQGWTPENLFHWSNSKYGRWLCDLATGTWARTLVEAPSLITLNGLEDVTVLGQ